jgi:hypothetical protein
LANSSFVRRVRAMPAAGIEIAGYRVIVELDEPLRVFSVDCRRRSRP